MKSTVFKKAWELYKLYKMTFSQALVEGWKFAKRRAIAIEVEKLNLSEWLQEIEFNKRIKNIKQTFYPIREQKNTIIDNSNARLWYGIGTYNGD